MHLFGKSTMVNYSYSEYLFERYKSASAAKTFLHY